MADAGKVLITPKGKYNASTTYEYLDSVIYDSKAFIACKTVTGITPSDDGINWKLLIDSAEIDPSSIVPEFTIASTRENINTKESLPILFGKIKKWFYDLKPYVFNDLVTNTTTTNSGSPLDATVGKILYDKITNVEGQIPKKETVKIDFTTEL